MIEMAVLRMKTQQLWQQLMEIVDECWSHFVVATEVESSLVPSNYCSSSDYWLPRMANVVKHLQNLDARGMDLRFDSLPDYNRSHNHSNYH